MRIVNTKVRTTRFEADIVAWNYGKGRLPTHAELDKFKMSGKDGAFWAKEWTAKGVLVEKAIKRGKDLADHGTEVLIEAKDVRTMKELHRALEEKHGKKIPAGELLYLVDPEALAWRGWSFVLENPKITVVENAVLGFGDVGIPAPETKIAIHAPKKTLNALPKSGIRMNFIQDGVQALARGHVIYSFNEVRNVDAYWSPFNDFGVLSVRD